MTHISDGNIFETMRLVLPEHRARMEEFQREREASERKLPVISQDRYVEFSVTIAEAIMNKDRIKVTLFGKYHDEHVEGIPIMDQGLRLVTEQSVVEIPRKRVIDVVRL